MLKSMYSGVSGLKVHQTKMDVIGDNIANVNTTAFKSSSVNFKDLFSQTLSNAQAPQGGQGGLNPRQVGLGVSMGSISVDQTQGNLQTTGKETDLAIDGNGYFVVNDGNQDLYTRAGNLSLDSDGNLVNSSTGNKVQGWMSDTGEINTDGDISDIKISIGESMDAKATEQVQFGGNLDSRIENGVNRSASIGVFDSLGKKHVVKLDFTRQIRTNLQGDLAVGGGNISINQEAADPKLNDFTVNFAADNDDELDITYDGSSTFEIAADWDGSDINAPTVDEIEDELNTKMDEAGFTGPVNISLTGGAAVGDLDGAGNLNLQLVDFGSGEQLEIMQDNNNPGSDLDGLGVNFVANDQSLDVSYDENEHAITVSADWDGSDGGTAPADLSEVEEEINQVLSDNGLDGQITLNLDPDENGTDFALSDFEASVSSGTAGTLTLSAADQWDWTINDSDGDGNPDIPDTIDDSVSGSGTLVFNSKGEIQQGGTGQITFNPLEVGTPVQNVEVIFDGENNSISQYAANPTLEGIKADGYESGSLNSFSLSDNGIITGGYSNGINNELGQIAIAKFANPDGLKKEGSSMFATSKNSGNAVVGVAGSGGRGNIKGGTLEMSNVDLAKEFTEMITAQRGFQANSKIISTSDQMLQDLVNLKR